MDDTENARAVAERYREAWLANDLAGIIDCYADDFSLHYFGNNPWTGSHIGKQAAFDTLLAVGAKAPRRLLAVDEVLAGPDAAVLVAREEITTAEGPVEIQRVLRYRVRRSHFVDCWLYEEHQDVIDRAWS